ncbi:helix-turn-helix domain-containing protein [Aquimarina algicola]|uniref:Helix-turn-helix transcriptional regulator n=1 Tax=Aquimarina algicola TaxID=2589995 RepID=A0A504IWP7_9FLAO|nr:helix-turn-helix transcriptional regulator [Aquimarina algicola]TPN82806.1 helix-turn-helix transcriptional regulator [Aquimarina algicola]
MDKGQLKTIRKELGLTQTELAKLVGVSPRTIQGWEYGDQKIPKTVEDFLNRQLLDNKSNSDTTTSTHMDVSGIDTLSMERMVEFCLKHKEEFLEIPSIKLLIELNRNEAKAELLEKHIILKNSNKHDAT